MQRGVVSIADHSGAVNLGLWAKALARAEGNRKQAQELGRAMPELVQKALQQPIVVGDADMAALSPGLQVLTAFASMLRNNSAFFYLWALNLMLKIPLRTRLSFLTGAATMSQVQEAAVIAVSRMVSDKVLIEPRKVTGILVFSDAFLKFLSSGGEAFLSLELRRAISTPVDQAFLEIINAAGAPTQPSGGATAADALDDVRYLLNSCELTADSRPVFLLSPDVARIACTLFGPGGAVFPALGPQGGQILNVPAVVTDALPDGVLGLVDGAAIAGDLEGFNLSSSTEATIELNDAPTSPPMASATLISLWQSHLTALKPEIYFGAARLRDTAFASVTGIAWANS